MIFVTVGASGYPFDRLIQAVEALDLDEEIVVQHGASAIKPRNSACFAFMPFEQVVAHVRAARAVVTHAGIGSILVAASNGKCPVVVPRRSRFAEAVYNHQIGAVRKLAEAGLVRLV